VQACESLALRLLAQRDHSRHELAQKLRQRCECDTESLAQLLDKFQELGYLDESRYAESFVRSSVARGRGPLKITYELRERGVDACVITQALEQSVTDWCALAQFQREKKFGVVLPADFKERARQSRFLAGRGFYTETIKAVFQ
jgi:regulatory protein